MSNTIAVLYKIKDFLHQALMYTFYCSVIVPYITYCVEFWINTCKMSFNISSKMFNYLMNKYKKIFGIIMEWIL